MTGLNLDTLFSAYKLASDDADLCYAQWIDGENDKTLGRLLTTRVRQKAKLDFAIQRKIAHLEAQAARATAHDERGGD